MKTGTAKSYKKVKKEEKNKKKLKTALKNVATKTQLPKGQNLTDTNFKVKKIVIRDQVKPHEEDEILYRKKLNVTELSARLGHHNSTIKTEALDGLKDMITSHPVEVLGSHYVQVLESVVKLVLDETAMIRKSACKIVGQILSAIARHKLVPVFASLNSYLQCGLTHIDRGVREDSLILMDCCLKHVPELCEKYAFILLSVCLDLISDKGLASRTLSLNLESSQVATKWRTKVLERISSLLHCFFNGAPKSTNPSTHPATQHFIPGTINHFPVHTGICLNYGQYAEQSPEENIHKVTAADFAEAIIPLLLGMFLEVNPAEKSSVENTSSTVISEESCKLLSLIVDIIQTLWEIIENLSEPGSSKALSKRFARSLMQTLVTGRFPYSVSSRSIGKSQKAPQESENSLTINLSVARLVLVFTHHSDWDPVLPFLKNSFRMIEQFSSFDTATFAACMTKICGEDGFLDRDYFFSKIVRISLEGKSQLCPYFFRILGDVALSTKMRHFHGHPDFEKWLASLPERVTRKKFQAYQLDVISQIAVRNFPSFANSLDVNIELILDNIPKVSFADDAKKDAIQWQMATLLHWVHYWDDELTESLQPAIQNCYWGERLTKYISEITSIKDASIKKTTPPLISTINGK